MEELSCYTDKIPFYIWAVSFFFLCLCFVILAIAGRRYLIRGMMWALMITYYVVVLCSTVFCRNVLPKTSSSYDLTPFWSYKAIADGNSTITYWEIVLNVLLFVPVGLLIGGFAGKVRNGWLRWLSVLLTGAILSCVIECLQYTMHKGFAETDDVIHNTIGCMVGYGIFCCLMRLKKRIKN